MLIVILGEPRGKGRPRFTRNGHPYTPRETVAYERQIAAEWRKQFGLKRINSSPVQVQVSAYYKIPQHASIADRERMMNGELAPQKKPDIDNVVKIVLDALNGVAYADDKQVVQLNAGKHYSTEPRVEIMIKELGLREVR